MTTIENTRELPNCPLRAYTIKDEAEAAQIANGRVAYIFKQTATAWYLFVQLD